MSDEDLSSTDDELAGFDSPHKFDLIYDEDDETITLPAVHALSQAVIEGIGGSEDLLEEDAELAMLQSNFRDIKESEIQYYKDIVNLAQSERGSHILQSQKVAIEFLAAANPDDQSFWLRRLYSTLTSRRFCIAISDRNVDAAMGIITQELLLYMGVQKGLVVLKKYWSVVLESLQKFMNVSIGVSSYYQIACGVLMILLGLGITTFERKSWDEVPFDTIRETLKVAVVLMASYWVSIPVCKFIDDVCDVYRYEVTAHGKSYVDAIPSTLWTVLQKYTVFSAWLVPPSKVSAADLYVDQYCHDEFICPITHDILEDPVSLHGTFFSRAPITKWVRSKGCHPYSKRRVPDH